MKKLLTLFLFVFLFASENVHAQLIINEVLYDPSNTALDGDANGDGIYSQTEDEFIELVNLGTSSINLGGYQIWDDTVVGSLVYLIPSGTQIPAKGALVIFGGGKPVGLFGGALVLADTGLVGLSFGNSGEKIAVKDSTGQTILFFDSDALSNNPNESYTRSPDLTGSFVQHTTVNTSKFSPGTKVNGSPFVSTPSKQITFKVDMNKYMGSFDSVFVSGNFNQWCAGCQPLQDNNRDGLWETSVSLTIDTVDFLFKVKVGTTSIQETFSSVTSCTRTNGSLLTRFVILKSDSVLQSVCFQACSQCPNYLQLKGVTDFITPVAGVSGKAIHLVSDSIIPNLSIYGIGIANNGGGSDGQEYRFPNMTVGSGSHILLVRDTAALRAYMSSCWPTFSVVLVDTFGVVNQNGDDAVELFKVGEAVETFGNINEDGTGKSWEYTGSWAYKNTGSNWIFGTINCTDSTTTIFDSDCIYPICSDIKVSTINVSGTGNVSAITQNGGTLKMLAEVLPTNASNKGVTWSVENPTVANISSDGLLTAVANGNAVVRATAKDGSGVFGTKTIAISGQSNSLIENQKDGFTIFPNPIENVLYIQSSKLATEYKIYSTFGQLMEAGNLPSDQLNIGHLPAGAYLLELKRDEQWLRNRIIKK